jgi:deoxycytidylate deaminase/plasmid stabilization system protein ParE
MNQAAVTGPTIGSCTNNTSDLVVQQQASNEFVFAVVGHVGSGTSKVATTLSDLLANGALPGGSFDTEIIKARELIESWALENGEAPPATPRSELRTTERFQDLGDGMRSGGDHAIVARRAVQRVRRLRAEKQGLADPGDGPVAPDGTRRAYIIDSIRHPAEVELLRRVYREAFVLIGVVCEAKVRLERLHSEKYTNAGRQAVQKFMDRDARATETHGQRVSDAFHMADFFVDNTVAQYREDGRGNEDWDINEKLSRLVKTITHAEIVRPTFAETAMHQAYGASVRSACLSRQVGAALVDNRGNVIATGTNEVPRAGGGVYGESFEVDIDDHRCAYRTTGRFCSNTREQNRIIDEIFDEIPELAAMDQIAKHTRKLQLRQSRVGQLIEFSRAIHAEMDALLSAGRKGVSTVGSRLFVTTFPCHFCARGIVSAGVDEVQYIEPYPKSLALELHSDAITVDRRDRDGHEWTAPSKGGRKAKFSAFTGVAPRLYARAFLKDRSLKENDTGDYRVGSTDWGTPWDIHRTSYVELEVALAKTP